MMSFLRKLILLTIVGLLAAAYITMQQQRESGEPDKEVSQLESILISISDKVPELQNDIKKLGEDIKKRLPELALQVAIQQQENPTSQETLPSEAIENATDTVPAQPTVSPDNLQDKLAPAVQLLKEKGAQDLARELEKIYEQARYLKEENEKQN